MHGIVYQWILTLLLLLAEVPAPRHESRTETIWLAKTPVNIQLTNFGEQPTGAVFINVHENEATSVLATHQYLADKDAVFIALQQQGNRHLAFRLQNRDYEVDPNRIFSKAGRIANLRLLNKKYSAAAEKAVQQFAEGLLARIQGARIVIAVHNNTDGPPLTVRSFAHYHWNPEMDEDNFILTTEPAVFQQLQQQNINVVLETTENTEDDGSLGYYCASRGIPYINVEAQHDDLAAQLSLLQAITPIIAQYTR